MTPVPKNPRAGERFVDRYMPNATPDERKLAIETFYGFVGIMMRIAARRADEEYEQLIRGSGDRAVESGDSPAPAL